MDKVAKKMAVLLVAMFAMGYCSVKASAEVVAKDTIALDARMEYRLEKVEKVNDFGEVNVRYVAIITLDGKERKVPITKDTYAGGVITHLVFNTNENGSRKIAKAIRITQ